MNKLIVTLPYCQNDHPAAVRLLKWIAELDGELSHALLLVADDAVPIDIKRSIDALGKTVFAHSETILVKAPAPVNGNYHVPAAAMFLRAMGHIDTCYKWNWLWLEPDAVPLKPGWLDTLATAYDDCPKRFLGATMKTDGKDLPKVAFFGTAVYPNCAHPELKQFCDGSKAFDMAFSDYVVARGQNTNLIHHAYGTPTDVPTFKETKSPTDGPNVGTLESLHKEAVLYHRNKDGTLIDLLRKQRDVMPEPICDPAILKEEEPTKKKRSPKQPESVGTP